MAGILAVEGNEIPQPDFHCDQTVSSASIFGRTVASWMQFSNVI